MPRKPDGGAKPVSPKNPGRPDGGAKKPTSNPDGGAKPVKGGK